MNTLNTLYDYLPKEFVSFSLVTIFSFLIGLLHRRMSLEQNHTDQPHFGSDRTFTFIGILGYLLYILDTKTLVPFLVGIAILGLILAVHYYVKQLNLKLYGATTIIIALITYCLGPIFVIQPLWFSIMVVVVVLLFAEMKQTFTMVAQKMDSDEIVTLAKFLAISGIILPILPKQNFIPGIDLTPYTVWLATVVVSGISYLSYLLKRYIFPESGVLLSGILGGLYSSTATISVMAKRGQTALDERMPDYIAGMLLAVSMMFLRFLILILIFSVEIAAILWPYLVILSSVIGIVAWRIHRSSSQRIQESSIESTNTPDNPLEFKVALIFAFLFIVFTVITHYTLKYGGAAGLNALSFLSGVSDITPFILNLLRGNVAVLLAATGVLQAMMSNVVVNMCYALFFSRRNVKMRSWIFKGFGLAIGANGLALLLFYIFHLW